MAGRIRWRARSGAGLGQAGEGAGKLEQLRKVPKVPGGGGARGAGLEMTPLATPPGGRGGRSSRWPEGAGSVSASRGAIRPREGPAGLGAPPPSSLQGRRRGLGVFQGRRKLLVRGPAPPLPLPLPRPGATLGFSTLREATADSPRGVLGGHSCCRKASSPKACRWGLFRVEGPGVLSREAVSEAKGPEGVLGWAPPFSLPENLNSR